MKTVFDSSSFAKRYIAEPGSKQVDAILRNTTELGLCILCAPEILSALNRRVREGSVSAADYAAIKSRLATDVRDATALQLTPAVITTAIRLLENNTLRAMDALHIACALEWQADHFVTADHRQLAAARQAGLNALTV